MKIYITPVKKADILLIELTHGKKYELKAQHNGYVAVVNDDGFLDVYDENWFKKVITISSGHFKLSK